MEVIHEIIGEKIMKEVELEDNHSLITSNSDGGFALLTIDGMPKSKYQGTFFIEEEEMFRVIEHVGFTKDKKKISSIINRYYEVEKNYGNNEQKERYFMPEQKNSLVYEYENTGDTEIFLDLKRGYEDENATYETKFEEQKILVEMKYKGKKYYLAVRHEAKIKYSNSNLFRRDYELDTKRGSYPASRNVLYLCTLETQNSGKIVLSFHKDKQEALDEAESVFNNLEGLKERKKQSLSKKIKSFSHGEEKMAYEASRASINHLSGKGGIFAGIPWFFQHWSRDELITLKALSTMNKELAESIIGRWSRRIKRGEFSIPTLKKINGELIGSSIDAVGWLFSRVLLFPKLLDRKEIREFLNLLDDEMQENKAQETWMDSIPRDGYCIEIQAMKLFMLKLAYEITGESEYKTREVTLRKKVRESFWNGNYLVDCSTERVLRPNVFIAYYFYPWLLSREAWERCFDQAIDSLWCDWGGLSTLNKEESNFISWYTGEDHKSYHNGDSWFWLNNIAAISMSRVNQHKFSDYINKIKKASTLDILYKGALGCHSELSSVKSQEANGCLCQAFSAATYMELIHETTKEE